MKSQWQFGQILSRRRSGEAASLSADWVSRTAKLGRPPSSISSSGIADLQPLAGEQFLMHAEQRAIGGRVRPLARRNRPEQRIRRLADFLAEGDADRPAGSRLAPWP